MPNKHLLILAIVLLVILIIIGFAIFVFLFKLFQNSKKTHSEDFDSSVVINTSLLRRIKERELSNAANIKDLELTVLAMASMFSSERKSIGGNSDRITLIASILSGNKNVG